MTAKRYILGEDLEIHLHCLTWNDSRELAEWLNRMEKPKSLQRSPDIFFKSNSVTIRAHPDDRETLKVWLVKAARMKDFEIQNE